MSSGQSQDPRASDSDRLAVVGQLEEAVADGRLTLAEFDERVARALQARYMSELNVLTADLSSTAPRAAEAEQDRRSRWVLAVFGSSRRRGRWFPSRRTKVVAVFGSCELDLRDAVLPASVITIRAVAFFGSVLITVPSRVDVELTGAAILGSNRAGDRDPSAGADRPKVRVKATAVLGSVTVDNPRKGAPAR